MRSKFLTSYISALFYILFKELSTAKLKASPSADPALNKSHNLSKLDSRIVGGYTCQIEQHPYMVSIRIKANYQHRCGGTILTEFWILTAAHCCRVNYKPKSFIVVAGATNPRQRAAQKSLVLGNYLHPQPEQNDIGLMSLLYPLIETPKVQFVHLAKYLQGRKAEDACGQSTVVGWGSQYAKNQEGHPISFPVPHYNPNLQCVQLSVISEKTCRRYYRHYYLPRNILCTYTKSKDACQGDSGGPLMCEDVQYGIVSFGIGCAFKFYAGVYTPVYRYTEFIHDTMLRNHGFCNLSKQTFVVKLPCLIVLMYWK